MTKRRIIQLLFFLGASFIMRAQEIHPMLENPRHGKTYVISHRGYHKDIPENTLAAYKKSIDIGCDFIEIDVRETKDKKFVSMHNATVDAYASGITRHVQDMTLKELKELDISSKFGDTYKNERISTLEEILMLCKDKIGIYLDFKAGNFEEVYRIIKKYDMLSQVVWYMPSNHFLQIYKMNTEFKGILFMPDPVNDQDLQTLFQVGNFHFIASAVGRISKDLIEQAHKNNIKVFVDDKNGGLEEWECLINKIGVDGIQTDEPIELIEQIKEQIKYRSSPCCFLNVANHND